MIRKFLLTAIVLFLFHLHGKSQDQIILNNGKIYNCKITGEDSIKYYFDIENKNVTVSSFALKSNVKSIVLEVDKRKNRDTTNNILYNDGSSFIGLVGNVVFDNNNSQLTIEGSINHFLANNLYIGGIVNYTKTINKDYQLNIGPELGWVIINSKYSPIVVCGFSLGYIKTKVPEFSSYYFKMVEKTYITNNPNFGVGFIARLNENVGILAKALYNMQYYSNSSKTENDHYISITFGISAFF